MEDKDWENHQWIFEPDGSLLDIYVQDVGLSEWIQLIKFLNQDFGLKFFRGDEDAFESNIDQDYVVDKLSGKIDTGALAHIFLKNIQVNCHFFILNEIEFDVRPKDIGSEEHFVELFEFIYSICKLLNKEIILTPENTPMAPYAFFNQHGQYKIYSKIEYAKLFS
ncbi:hypothetical protein [Leptospira alstonii]|uniref:Uncharacterized protein n=2 Tax=Leptospira alstonii TaxID=28452 RepID=M6CVL6_9LEPT|nr:hypothetical protein [Leptospira alstonii]EMJ94521.1 hypothetical protein LEP1GSC194_1423 [Leptospira alstonii serovar Sichuan str. 79601]EQA79503.1 hypothetical protein LEP1GSC193_0475 [Leptospira alstonii serovar Pingchang str. 80-412]